MRARRLPSQVTDDLAQAVEDADYVTEAAPEKLELKQTIFADLVALAPANAILATEHIGDTDTPHRRRPREPRAHRRYALVEPAGTDSLGRSHSVGRDLGRHHSHHHGFVDLGRQKPAHVTKDVPGFVANRLQHALWREAIAMVAAGVAMRPRSMLA